MTAQPGLFDEPAEQPKERRPDVFYRPGLFRDLDLAAMLDDIKPEQFRYNMFGTTGPRPRLEAWFHPSMEYSFGGGAPMLPREWTPLLDALRRRVETSTGESFDSCFANYYTDGKKHIDKHADDEDWIDEPIVSVTIGAARRFVMEPKDGGPERHEWSLGHGDFLLMRRGTQGAWLHSIRKTSKPVGPRLNLTFRRTRGVR